MAGIDVIPVVSNDEVAAAIDTEMNKIKVDEKKDFLTQAIIEEKADKDWWWLLQQKRVSVAHCE